MTLEQTLRKAEAAKQGSYDKRTEHLQADGSGQFINRLILEDSPYLLQHAHNPVNWYPWGEEAFATARQENKPVFLSIGYSTCHWCHVMEVESFDNVEVAKLLNRDFIAIKLDREQYPDIDEIYMTGVQMMSGHGGWPMSNFMLPDGRPFFGGTYFPAATFMELLNKITDAWANKKEELTNSAASVDSAIRKILDDSREPEPLEAQVLHNCIETLLKREDKQFGGLAGAPKFPQEPLLLFMLDQAIRGRSSSALDFVDRALHGMAEGGIYDQVGGGFHRYSVDQYWLVPHFEKMLYNQSQLGLVYLQAWAVTGKPFYRRIVEQTLDYVLRDMQDSSGGFYSATDADSEGEEGTFFLWTREQLEEVLEPQEVVLAVELFGITDDGNFEGSNIPNLQAPLAESIASSQADLLQQLDRILGKLYEARELRIHPLRDDKLIAGWNAAMIHTLAQAAWQLSRDDWLAAAIRAADTLLEQLVAESGELQRISLDGTTSIPAQLEDYGAFCEALITLFDVTRNADYLQHAMRIMDYCLGHFWDAGKAGFYLSAEQQAGPLLARSRNAADGATLSPVAATLISLQRLQERSALLDSEHNAAFYQGYITAALNRLAGSINEHALSHTSLLRLHGQIEHGAIEFIRYASNGLARITSEQHPERSNALTLHITLQPGWHLTAPPVPSVARAPREAQDKADAQQSGAGDLQALAISNADKNAPEVSVNYPAATGELQQLGRPVAIYEREVAVQVVWPDLSDTVTGWDNERSQQRLRLTLQLCNAKECLLPEELTLYFC